MEPTTGLPSILAQGIASLTRSGFNVLAGVLVAKGAITDDQQTQLVTIAVAVVLWGAGLLWSMIKNRDAHKAVKVALATPAPEVSALVKLANAGSEGQFPSRHNQPAASRPSGF